MSKGTYFIQITSQCSVGNTIFIMFANMLAFIKMCTALKKDSWWALPVEGHICEQFLWTRSLQHWAFEVCNILCHFFTGRDLERRSLGSFAFLCWSQRARTSTGFEVRQCILLWVPVHTLSVNVSWRKGPSAPAQVGSREGVLPFSAGAWE